MKAILLGAIAATLLLFSSLTVSAQEMAVRRGVVTAMQAVTEKSSAVSSSTKRQLGSMLGRALGRAVGEKYGYEAANMGASLVSDLATSGDQQRASGSYVVMIQFNDGSETAITFKSEQLNGIRVGSAVKVVGSGSSAMITAG